MPPSFPTRRSTDLFSLEVTNGTPELSDIPNQTMSHADNAFVMNSSAFDEDDESNDYTVAV